MAIKNEKSQRQLDDIMGKLEQGVKDVFSSERYAKYLATMAKFHDYSINNLILIAMQRPEATLVAGYQAWKKKFERNVMQGEKGIKILAPSPYKVMQKVEQKDPLTGKTLIGKDGKPVTEEKEIMITAYRVVTVFDVSQTEGKELPAIAGELNGKVNQYERFFAALEKTSPVPVGFEQIKGGAHGYYSLDEKRIVIDAGMSDLQNLKTMIHEIAHAKMHDIDLNALPKERADRPDRRTREVQAESVAYAVCQHYGLDTSDYSFNYIASWSSGRELAELKDSLATIRATAAELINTIDEHIAELQKEQEDATLKAEQKLQSDKAVPEERKGQGDKDMTIEENKISIFRLEMNSERYYCENTSGLDAEGLCKAYAECKLPYVEMMKYGRSISIEDYAYIEQGEKLLFAVNFDADRDEITISDGKQHYETKGLKETIAEKRAQGCRQSVLQNLHSKQQEIRQNPLSEQKNTEKTDRRMER